LEGPSLSPGYALAQDLKKRSLTEKNQASYAGFAQSCRNYAGKRKKKKIIAGFLSFASSKILGS